MRLKKVDATNLGHVAPLSAGLTRRPGFPDSGKRYGSRVNCNWCGPNDRGTRKPVHSSGNRIPNSVHQSFFLVESLTLKRKARSQQRQSAQGRSYEATIKYPHYTGWTERTAYKSRLCLERRWGKRSRSSETAESVRDERAGCGWCCFSDRWDLPIQMAG